MKYKEIIDSMTLREKANFCSGVDFWHLAGNERFNIPSIMVTDGPHGLRKQRDKNAADIASGKGADMLAGVPSVCFPPACATANSWDPELLYKMGECLGEECLQEKVSVILGPGTNIKRSPLCGRNFEYFSEDPLLAGEMAAAWINGVQSKGVGTSLKHFAGNNQETRRLTVDTVADERTFREIYLTAFETAVKKAHPWTVMNAYNRLNGSYCAENKWLLTDVLRDEWGFEGIVMTDWGAENDRVAGLKAGQELEMPSSNGLGDEKIVEAVLDGSLDESVLDTAVDKLLDLIFRSKETLCDFTYDSDAHHDVAREIAEQSMVLLKNENSVLPISKDKTIAVIGEMAKAPRYQGAGSSLIDPIKLDSAFNAFLSEGAGIIYSPGYNKKKDTTDARIIADAVAAAKHADVAVLFIGLTENYESEGFDRTHIHLPASHNALVNAVADVNDNTVVVLSGGAPVDMPWLGKVKAVLNGYLGGQAGGSAMVNILLGKVNPSGKLAETYPLTLEDCSATKNFPGARSTVEYRESVFVGYRYYDSVHKDVLFPFGFGLSYTSFKYSALKISKKKLKDSDTLKVSFKIKNTGDIAGAETAQLYVKDTHSTIFRPEKELRGFSKVYLEPGEEKTVEIELGKRAFAFWNVNISDWYVESGDFDILVGASSRDIKLSGTVNVTSSEPDAAIPDYSSSAPSYYNGCAADVPAEEFEAVLGRPIPPTQRDPKQPLTLNNSLEDAADTRRGAKVNAFIKGALNKVSALNIGGTGDMLAAMALEMPMKNFVSMSMGVFSQEMADGLLEILNDDGDLKKGAMEILKGLVHAITNIGSLQGVI